MTVPEIIAYEAVNEYGAAQKIPELTAAIARIIELDPKIIVEIGCDSGGTLYAWGKLAPFVYGITLEKNDFSTGGSGRPLNTHGAMVRIGDSHDWAARDWLEVALSPHRVNGNRVVDALIIDGDHTVMGVCQDFFDYAPLVRPGGLILLHDVMVSTDARAQVYKAWPAITQVCETMGWDWTIEYDRYSHPLGWGIIKVAEK